MVTIRFHTYNIFHVYKQSRIGTMYQLSDLYLSSCFFFFSSRRRHTRFDCDWSSDVCSSDLKEFFHTMVRPRVWASRTWLRGNRSACRANCAPYDAHLRRLNGAYGLVVPARSDRKSVV